MSTGDVELGLRFFPFLFLFLVLFLSLSLLFSLFPYLLLSHQQPSGGFQEGSRMIVPDAGVT